MQTQFRAKPDVGVYFLGFLYYNILVYTLDRIFEIFTQEGYMHAAI